MVKRRIEFELDEEQVARLDWLCRRTGKTRQQLLQEGLHRLLEDGERLWDLENPADRAALDKLQAEALPPWDETPG